MTTGEQLVPDVSVTQRLLGTAAGRGSGAPLGRGGQLVVWVVSGRFPGDGSER